MRIIFPRFQWVYFRMFTVKSIHSPKRLGLAYPEPICFWSKYKQYICVIIGSTIAIIQKLNNTICFSAPSEWTCIWPQTKTHLETNLKPRANGFNICFKIQSILSNNNVETVYHSLLKMLKTFQPTQCLALFSTREQRSTKPNRCWGKCWNRLRAA